MKDKKVKLLDIIRLLFAVTLLVTSLILIVRGIQDLKGALAKVKYQSDLDKLRPQMLDIGLLTVYLVVSIGWAKRFFAIKRIPLIDRTNPIIGSIIKSVLFGVFLKLSALPLIAYWVLDAIEGVLQVIQIKRLRAENGPDYRVERKKFCRFCGKQVDKSDSVYCEYCGKQIR